MTCSHSQPRFTGNSHVLTGRSILSPKEYSESSSSSLLRLRNNSRISICSVIPSLHDRPVTSSTRNFSNVPSGRNSSVQSLRILRNSLRSVWVVNLIVVANIPWRHELRDDLSFPSFVRGPVEAFAFLRFAAMTEG